MTSDTQAEKKMGHSGRPGGSYLDGVKSVFQSLGLLKQHRGLALYFIIPLAINILVLTAGFYVAFMMIEPRLSSLVAGEGWFFDALRLAVAPVIFLVLAILTVLLYSVLGSIVTAPFNDFLSAAVEKRLGSGFADEPFSLRAFFADIFRITGNIIKMLGLLLGASILLFFLNAIPVAGSTLYTAISFLTTSFFLGFQFFDFPLERRRFSFRDKLRLLWRFRGMTAGVGTGFFLASFIPFVGFLALNLATIAATRLFLEHMKEQAER